MTVLIDNIAGICNSSGTGNMNVSGVYAGADPWSNVPNGSQVSYRREYLDKDADGLDYEVGVGVYNSGFISSRSASSSTSGESVEHDFGSAETLVALVASAAELANRLEPSGNLSDVSSASASRANLGLEIGVDVQPYSAALDATTASFTTADEAKLDGVEAGATADQTGAEIKSAYESEADTNAFTDAEKTKLSGVEPGADVTDTTNVTAAGALMESEVDSDIKTLSLPPNTTISTFGASIIDDSDAATARATIGVDPSGTDNSIPVTVSGEDFLSLTGQEITANPIDLDNLSATGTPSSSTFLRGDNTWAAPAGGGGGDLLAANNLADVASAPTSRANLGLEIGSDVQAHSAILDATTASYTASDEAKLGGIEAGADVTDTANVTAAGALMDAEFSGALSEKLSQKPASEPYSALVFGQSQVTGANADAPTTPMAQNTAIRSFQSDGVNRATWANYSYEVVDPNAAQSADFLSDRPYTGMIKGGAGNVGYSFFDRLNDYTGRDGYLMTTHMGLFGLSNWEPNLAGDWGDSVSTIDHIENLAPLALAAVPGSPASFDVVIMMLGDTDVINNRGVSDSVARFNQIREHFISIGIITDETPWLIGGKFGGSESAYSSRIFEYLDQETPAWVQVIDPTGIPLNAAQPDVHYSGDGLIQFGQMMADVFYRRKYETQKPYIAHKIEMGTSPLSALYTVDSMIGAPQAPASGEVNVELDGSNDIQSIQVSKYDNALAEGPSWRYVEAGKAFSLIVNIGIYYYFTVDSVTEQPAYFDISVTQTSKGGTPISAGLTATIASEEPLTSLPSDPDASEVFVATEPAILRNATLATGGPNLPGVPGDYSGAPPSPVVATASGALYRSLEPAVEGWVTETVGDGSFNELFTRSFEIGDYFLIEGRLIGRCESANEILSAKFETYGYVTGGNILTALNGSDAPTYENTVTGNDVTVSVNGFSVFAGIFNLSVTVGAARSGETWVWSSYFKTHLLGDAS